MGTRKCALYDQLTFIYRLKSYDSMGTRKCALYDQLTFLYRLKLYALVINGENEAALYRQ